ncbi:hypothetical protein F5X68DRAFT_235001 [Plectosphaerella plurivora]|uniref:DUF6594 domain-containing protein n=1 Tax=Plectosphaerella plurivora TaxID=936078 RepID=A0A9P9A5V2_9PEZI|nr:hypothetical protein F5X68DRAFT_235001 [Plectosphaerella plurivora]
MSNNIDVGLTSARNTGYNGVCVLAEDVERLDAFLAEENVCRQIVQHMELRYLCHAPSNEAFAIVQLTNEELDLNNSRGVANTTVCELDCLLCWKNVESSGSSELRVHEIKVGPGVRACKARRAEDIESTLWKRIFDWSSEGERETGAYSTDWTNSLPVREAEDTSAPGAASTSSVGYASGKKIATFISWLSTILAALLLVGAVVALYITRSDNLKLGLIALFTTLFAASVGLLTNAKKAEVFGATAAYAAVLVVFVSGDLGQ